MVQIEERKDLVHFEHNGIQPAMSTAESVAAATYHQNASNRTEAVDNQAQNKPGARLCLRLEDILADYFGFSAAGEVDGPEWVAAYNRLVSCVEAIGHVTGKDVSNIIRELDIIDSELV